MEIDYPILIDLRPEEQFGLSAILEIFSAEKSVSDAFERYSGSFRPLSTKTC